MKRWLIGTGGNAEEESTVGPLLGRCDDCRYLSSGDEREFSGKRRWIVGIEGADKSQRGLVENILE